MASRTHHNAHFSSKALYQTAAAFLRSLKQKRPDTRGTYERTLREFLRWAGTQAGFRFQEEEIRRYKRYLTQRKRLSAVSVSAYLTSVRRYAAYLVQAGVLAENPAQEVEGNTRPRTHSREVLAAADVDMLLGAVARSDERGKRDYAFIQLMAGCALSEIEIVRANTEDLHLEPFHASLSVQGKGRWTKDAIVTLTPEARAAIEEYLTARGTLAPGDPLFTSAGNRTRGQRMTTRGVRDRVNYYLEQTGIKQGKLRRITPYSLRHSAAVRMAEAGASADEIRDRLRLGSVATAMLYIQRTGKDDVPIQHS